MTTQPFQQMAMASCGAAALTCAASELGMDLPILGHLNQIEQNRFEYWNGIARNPDTRVILTNSRLIQEVIYRVTGQRRVGEGGGLSWPHRLVIAARHLNLNPTVYLDQLSIAGLYNILSLGWFNRQLRNIDIRKIPMRQFPPLTRRQRAIVFVSPLHWVMQRNAQNPSGRYMDPDNGLNYNNLSERGLREGGIKILLRN